MIGFFSVKNWEEYQHYKDRDPTWIKLYNRLLDNYDFSLLPDASKWHLIGIFLLASRYKNRIPADAAWIAKKIGATTTVDLTLLSKSDFIEIDQVRTEALAAPYHHAIPEKRREEVETEEELTSADADPSEPSEDAKPETRKTSYPEAFETFWREYPTDPLMSKKKAFESWKRLDQPSREAARAAIPAFKEHCRKNPTYRAVHANRFLSERRFDGFSQAGMVTTHTPEELAALEDRINRKLKRGKYAEGYQ